MVTLGNLKQIITEMPKTELHLHLEGSIPVETLYQLIQNRGGDPSITSLKDLENKLTYTNFSQFIEIWYWKNTFIQEERDFEEIAYQALRNLSKQNVQYLEAFYSPGDFKRQELEVKKITDFIIRGMQRAYRDYGIKCELIVDLVRDHGPEVGMQRLDELTPYLGKGVIGVGLGGSEQLFPADPYSHVYEEDKHRGFRLTAHAREVEGPASIWAAIRKLGSERIGHGARAHEDPQLVTFLKEQQIPLELCVVSNIKTKVFKSVESHPIKQYYDNGLLVTVNSDDPEMFNTSITQEYLVLAQTLNFQLNDIKQLTMNGIEASFMSENDKISLKTKFSNEWDIILQKYT